MEELDNKGLNEVQRSLSSYVESNDVSGLRKKLNEMNSDYSDMFLDKEEDRVNAEHKKQIEIDSAVMLAAKSKKLNLLDVFEEYGYVNQSHRDALIKASSKNDRESIDFFVNLAVANSIIPNTNMARSITSAPAQNQASQDISFFDELVEIFKDSSTSFTQKLGEVFGLLLSVFNRDEKDMAFDVKAASQAHSETGAVLEKGSDGFTPGHKNSRANPDADAIGSTITHDFGQTPKHP